MLNLWTRSKGSGKRSTMTPMSKKTPQPPQSLITLAKIGCLDLLRMLNLYDCCTLPSLRSLCCVPYTFEIAIRFTNSCIGQLYRDKLRQHLLISMIFPAVKAWKRYCLLSTTRQLYPLPQNNVCRCSRPTRTLC